MEPVQHLPQDLLLCVFVHGFKGDDTTFGDFPSRLAHNLQETIKNVTVESILFPVYETKGDLRVAVDEFVEWLQHQVLKREVARATELGETHRAAGMAKVVLCGHSMGGLVVADALLSIEKTFTDGGPLWPRIIALLAYDTPYLGLHPNVFKNQASEGVNYVNTAHQVVTGLTPVLGAFGLAKNKGETGKGERKVLTSSSTTPSKASTSSPWAKWAAIGGAVVASGAAATAWYHREQLTNGVAYGWNYLTDHFQFVGNLWNDEAMDTRLSGVLESSKTRGIVFRAFYAYLPKKEADSRPRTFIVLPSRDSPAASRFIAAPNSSASDEIHAHMGMFSGKTNDGYYELGAKTVHLIMESVCTLLESEKTMHVFEKGEHNEQAEFEQNRNQVAKDGSEAEATTKAEKPSDAELSGALTI